MTKSQEMISYVGDPQIFKNVANLFLQEQESMIQLLKKAIESENMDMVISMAHKLSGAALTFGENNISETCLQIEALANKRESEMLKSIEPILMETINDFNRSLRQVLENVQSKSA